jgi:prevent-host-death family protein
MRQRLSELINRQEDSVHFYPCAELDKRCDEERNSNVYERLCDQVRDSDLRSQIKRVLNEVGYGQVQYVVEKFGEPTAAIISMEDFRLLQSARRQQATSSLQEIIAGIRDRSQGLDPDELDALIEADRAEFYSLRSRPSDAP